MTFWTRWILVFIIIATAALGASALFYAPDECGVLKKPYRATSDFPVADAFTIEEPTCILDQSYESFGYPAFVLRRCGALDGCEAAWTWYPSFLVMNLAVILVVSFWIAVLWQRQTKRLPPRETGIVQ